MTEDQLSKGNVLSDKIDANKKSLEWAQEAYDRFQKGEIVVFIDCGEELDCNGSQDETFADDITKEYLDVIIKKLTKKVNKLEKEFKEL